MLIAIFEFFKIFVRKKSYFVPMSRKLCGYNTFKHYQTDKLKHRKHNKKSLIINQSIATFLKSGSPIIFEFYVRDEIEALIDDVFAAQLS